VDQAERLRELVNSKKQDVRENTDAAENGENDADLKHHEASPTTKVIAIASGKGGVGKSNFTVNVAIELSKMGNRVMILDADLGLANVDILLGINPKYNLAHVIRGEKELKDIITETEYGVKVLANGSGVKELINVSNQQRALFIDKISELEDMVDILLIDTGAGISKNTMSFIYASDYSIIITTPEPTALMDAYGLIKVTSLNKSTVPLKLIVNMVNSREEAKEIASRVVLLARRFLNVFVESYGFIYRDRHVTEGVMAQKPFSVLHPGTKAAECIKEIAGRVSMRLTKENEKVPENAGAPSRGVFKRIFELFQ
jgi:flagellar biosynthesis protein FlhG